MFVKNSLEKEVKSILSKSAEKLNEFKEYMKSI